MSYETILTEQHGRVLLVTLNRPQALNALNRQLAAELIAAAQAADKDPAIGCLVVTGSAKAFAAGADIKEMQAQDFSTMYAADWFGEWERFTAVRKPVIAAVAGYALGGGCELAMMCDMIIAAENAKFGQPEIKLGTIPGLGGTQRLTRAIGKAKAMDLVLSGRFMDVKEAESAGLVARVLPVENFVAEVLKIAEGMAAFSSPVLMMAKQCVNAALETTLEQGLAYERRVFHATFALEDQKEGMAAFVEKRTPNFKNM